MSIINHDRQSNIEIMRIIAMVMIIASHYTGHGIMQIYSTDLILTTWIKGTEFNKVFSCIIGSGGGVGVAIFFMISGYFLSQSNKTHFVKIGAEVFFYSIICGIIATIALMSGYEFYGMGKSSLIVNFVRNFFVPVTNGKTWWFVTVYVLIDFVHPLINSRYNNYSITIKRRILFLVWFFWLLLALICDNIFADFQRAIFFYLLGSYIASKTNRQGYKKRFVIIVIVLFLCSWISASICNFVHATMLCNTNSLYNQVIMQLSNTIWGAIFDVICALCIFSLFITKKMKSIKCVNLIGKTTFGIYLLHNNPLMRPIIWHSIFKVDTRQYFSKYFWLFSLITVIIVFVICCFIDYLRIVFFERKTIKFINKVFSSITN